MTTTELRPTPARGVTHRRLLRRVGTEIVVIFAFVVFYKAARLLSGKDRDQAFGNARALVDFERWLHLPREQTLQDLIVRNDVVTQFCNLYYAQVSFPATLGGLLWLVIFRPHAYPWGKWAFMLASTVSLFFFFCWPMAPPRMLPDLGFIDTGALFGQSAYGNPTADRISNQFAAMPSLHCGWALIIAVVFIASGRTRWRWLWLTHVLLTFTVVVATSNHYWLDGVVGWAICGGALWLTRGLCRRPDPHPRGIAP